MEFLLVVTATRRRSRRMKAAAVGGAGKQHPEGLTAAAEVEYGAGGWTLRGAC